jgi:hypothetical protein
MRIATSLVVFAALAVQSPGSPEKPPSTNSTISVCKAKVVCPMVFEQVTTAPPESGITVASPASSIEAGLVQVRKVSPLPIVAMAESQEWFFYATSDMKKERPNGETVMFISGFAIKRNTCRVVSFGVW